jgi:hypothetical protein
MQVADGKFVFKIGDLKFFVPILSFTVFFNYSNMTQVQIYKNYDLKKSAILSGQSETSFAFPKMS